MNPSMESQCDSTIGKSEKQQVGPKSLRTCPVKTYLVHCLFCLPQVPGAGAFVQAKGQADHRLRPLNLNTKV